MRGLEEIKKVNSSLEAELLRIINRHVYYPDADELVRELIAEFRSRQRSR